MLYGLEGINFTLPHFQLHPGRSDWLNKRRPNPVAAAAHHTNEAIPMKSQTQASLLMHDSGVWGTVHATRWLPSRPLSPATILVKTEVPCLLVKRCVDESGTIHMSVQVRDCCGCCLSTTLAGLHRTRKGGALTRRLCHQRPHAPRLVGCWRCCCSLQTSLHAVGPAALWDLCSVSSTRRA